ncbi:MAG: 50S ribosomal protein L21e [Nitrososphaerota archaeon]
MLGLARHHGYRSRTRTLTTKPAGSRMGPRPDVYLVEYPVGSKVVVVADPSVQKGMPHKRYHGKVGVVLGRRGRGYEVEVYLGSKRKILYVLPDHIRPHNA